MRGQWVSYFCPKTHHQERIAIHAHDIIFLYTLDFYCASAPGHHVIILLIIKPTSPES